MLGIPQLDESFRQNPVSATAENARKHEEWRQLQNRVANDAEIKAALRTADAAHTDLEKRRLLRTYYEIYFGKMITLASNPEIKTYLVARKATARRFAATARPPVPDPCEGSLVARIESNANLLTRGKPVNLRNYHGAFV